jgi:hypothetical protein
MITVFTIAENGEIQEKSTVKRSFDLKPGIYQYEITPFVRKRSNKQNSYFHAIMPQIQKGLYDAGWRNVKTAQDAKRFVKELFLTVEVENELTGEKIKDVRGTSTLNAKEMGDLIEEIHQWAAEYLSLTIYSPNEQSAFNY